MDRSLPIWLFALSALLLFSRSLMVQAKSSLKTFESFEEYETVFSESNHRELAETVPPSATKWPQYVPPGPFFFDTDCFGKFNKQCTPRTSKFCKWYTISDPTCYDTRFVSVTIPPCQVENQASVPLHVRFFQFNWGVHLVEGTFFKRFYSLTVDECATKCLQSSLGSTNYQFKDKLRCMSFDFYPFEVWISDPPYNEAQDKGICVLNNETKDTARLRNEDQGLTDAELYYKSHCTYRPFSPLDGYYEVRDPRGALTPLLEYAGPSSLGLEAPWGGSRWGMFHPNLPGYLPQPLTQTLNCYTHSSDAPPPPAFRGGFTPINDDQKCPGLMTKSEARQLCTSRGGELCKNQTDLNYISGRKLGCSFDQAGNGNIWHEGLEDKGMRYPRCCATYYLPLNNVVGTGGVCEPYEPANIAFCGSFKTVTECLYTQRPNDPFSKYRQSWTKGFAHGLDDIRNQCLQETEKNPNLNCADMNLGPWATKTNCIWCPQAGLLPVGGNGECRPGGSYGICESASEEQKQIFAIRVRSACSEETNCALIAAFPDLRPYMGNYTFTNVGPSGEDMPSTAQPSTKQPTRFPTKRKKQGKKAKAKAKAKAAAATKAPSSASPTSASPTSSPTMATNAPVNQPTGPTKKVTGAPIKKL